jgi:uncharacterized membrane protein
MKPLPTLGGDNGFATGANNRRQVVGWAETDVVDDTCEENVQVLQFRAALWDLWRDETHELPPLGTDSSGAATAINDRGQVVGISGDCDQAVGRFTARSAVIWENGVPRKLDDLGGPRGTRLPRSISAATSSPDSRRCPETTRSTRCCGRSRGRPGPVYARRCRERTSATSACCVDI